ncbi:MAG: oxygen-insensitive NADPH nitroreductase [Gammaproteobacteria bacterium]|nr:oxygen-insensitive NADPH nitroreductase [Gammaproteobacteria bacterium]
MNPVIDLLNSHRSIRRFSAREVPQALVEELVVAGQSASTSSFIQGCTVIQVGDAEHRKLLAAYAGDQPYVEKAPLFLVFCADMQRHRLACDMHGAEMKSGYTEQFITTTVDCALFAQNLMIAAESVGLGGVFIGGIRNRIKEVAELLRLPELVYPVFGMCLGYPDQAPVLRPRLPLPVVLKQERYDDEGDRERIAEYDHAVREYYMTRTGGKKDTAWSEQISGMLGRESRPHMLAFLQRRGFLLK